MSQRGVVHILLVGVVVIFLVIVVIVAIVVSLDRVYQEQTSKSLFSEDSKIAPVVEDLRQRKESLRERAAEAMDKQELEAGEPKPKPSGSVDERLADIKQRLETSSR